MNYQGVLADVVSWAERESNVRAVILTGSAASNAEHPLSDRDLELHVQQRGPLENSDEWWSSLGDVLAVERLENGEDQPTRLIYYVGGKLDFTLIRIDEERGVYDRPFTVLLDKDEVAGDFTLCAPTVVGPTQAVFDESANWAGAAVLMTAKAIMRDEPWSVMMRDADFKVELLRMIEWDHILRYGSSRDVRYLGTQMRSWMDIGVQHVLDTCTVTYGADNRDALSAGIEFFSRLSHQVAGEGGLAPFPFERIETEVLRIFSASSWA